MTSLRIVLVQPQIAANLGFVARVLSNFGLQDWVAVGGVEVAGSEAERTGAPALEVLQGLRRVQRLEQALEGCTVAIGLTARDGFRRAPLPLEELRRELGPMDGEGRVALVFGREDRGLETEECEACSHLVRIQTAGLGSLNLSHAVAITLYEWFRGQLRTPHHTPSARPAETRWAEDQEKQRFVERALVDLQAAGFREDDSALRSALRRILSQPIEGRDLRLLDRIARHAEWLRDSGRGAVDPKGPELP